MQSTNRISANTASHGRGYGGNRGRGGCNGGFGRGSGGCGNGDAEDAKPPRCKICKKNWHTTDKCYKRFDKYFTLQERSSNSAATSSYNVDTDWFTDTGATDHITAELDKVTTHERYKGGDHVKTANGADMVIAPIGQSTVCTPNKNIVLNDVLHVPSAKKSLASIHCLTHANNVSVEYHPYYFWIRIGQRGVLFFAASVKVAFTLFLAWSWHRQCLEVFLLPPNPVCIGGKVV